MNTERGTKKKKRRTEKKESRSFLHGSVPQEGPASAREAQRGIVTTEPLADGQTTRPRILAFFGHLLRACGASTRFCKPARSWGGTRSSPEQGKNMKRLLCLPGPARASTPEQRRFQLPSSAPAPPCQNAARHAACTATKGFLHIREQCRSFSQRLHLRKPPLFSNTPGKGTIIPSNSIPTSLHPATHRSAAQKAANNASDREPCCNQGLHAMSNALITTVILEA